MTEQQNELVTQEEAQPPGPPLVQYNKDPAIRTRGYELVASANKASCLDEEQRGLCITLDDYLKVQLQVIDERRKLVTAPMDQAKAAVMEPFNAEKKAMTAARERVQKLILAFNEKKDAEARALAEEGRKAQEEEALANAEAMAEAGRHEEAENVLQEGAEMAEAVGGAPETKTVRGVGGGTASFTEVWKFEIQEPSLIPRIYCIPDDKLIREAIRRKDEPVREIPGVRVYSEKKMVNR